MRTCSRPPSSLSVMLDAHRVPITRRATHGEQTFFASRRCLSLPRHRPAREMEGHASAYLRPRPALIEPFRGGRLQFARPLKLPSSERPLRTSPLQMGNGDSPLASGVSPAGRPSKGSPCQRVVALRGHVVSSTSATMLSCSATPPSERVQLYEAEAHRNAGKTWLPACRACRVLSSGLRPRMSRARLIAARRLLPAPLRRLTR